MKRECTPDQQHGRRVRQANDIWRNLVNHHLRGLFLLLPLLLCGVASAAELKIVIPRMAETPTIDGKLAPGEWKGAAEVAGMIDQFDRAVHFFPPVAGISIYHGCNHSPGFRACPRFAGHRCQRVFQAGGRLPGQSQAGNHDVVWQFGSLAPFFPIRCQSRLPQHAPPSDRHAPAATSVRSLHLLSGRNPSPSAGDRCGPAKHLSGADNDPHHGSAVLWRRLASA